MKKIITIFLTFFICILCLSPVNIYANTYRLSDTDLSISLLKSIWYVFTRDSIKDKDELKQYGISYNEMYHLLYDNDAYMYAIMLDESRKPMELLLIKKDSYSDIVNLTNYDHNYVLEFAKQNAEKADTDQYSTFSNRNGNKFIKIENYDPDLGLYVCDFATIVNKDLYILKFQSSTEFTDVSYSEMNWIVNSCTFNIDKTLKEPETDVDETLKEPETNIDEATSSSPSIITYTAIGAIGIVGLVLVIMKKRQ